METGIKPGKDYKLKINYKELFISLGFASFNIISHKYDNLIGNLEALIKAVGVKDDIQKAAYKLIFNSLTDSLKELLLDNFRVTYSKSVEKQSLEKLYEEIKFNFKTTNIIINDNFFKNPKSLNLLKDIKLCLRIILKELGYNETDSRSIAERLPTYFVFALNQEWMNNHSYYKGLLEVIESPFQRLAQREIEWHNYSLWLQKLVEAPIFNESFSIAQIYIPLRGYHSVTNEIKDLNNQESLTSLEPKYKVVDLMEHLSNWIENPDPEDAIRFIYGGPGSGKSVFSKIFAAKINKDKNIKVLFVALQRFDVTGDLISSLNIFLQNSIFFSEDSINLKDEHLHLLIIFDGLDELSMQGKVSNEMAKNFIIEVENKVRQLNMQKKRMMALITGRTITMQSSSHYYDRDPRYLRILPYKIQKNEAKNFIDAKNLVNSDQRDAWWIKYGELIGKDYKGIPNVFRKDKLAEVTAQPLLNYLVALSYIRDKIDFTKETNLNMIYSDLIEAVYDRNYSFGGTSVLKSSNIDLKHFFRILEEISITTWHGKGRTTTVREIEEHLENANFKKILNEYMKIAEGGIVNLLTAFYFQQSGYNFQGEKTFEFTHKTFREYLTARRIISFVEFAYSKYRNHNTSYEDDLWDERKILSIFLKLFGPRSIDYYLLSFIKDELSLKNDETRINLQVFLTTLIEFLFKHGILVEKPSLNQKTINENIMNAEKAVFILLSACSNTVKKPSKVVFPSKNSLGNWINKISILTDSIDPILFYFDYLELEKVHFQYLNLSYANFKNSHFCDCNFGGVSFDYADFSNVLIDHETHFRHSEFWNTKFIGSHVNSATFIYCSFKNTVFENVKFHKVVFKKCFLENIGFVGTSLNDCKFIDCIITKDTLEKIRKNSAEIENVFEF